MTHWTVRKHSGGLGEERRHEELPPARPRQVAAGLLSAPGAPAVSGAPRPLSRFPLGAALALIGSVLGHTSGHAADSHTETSWEKAQGKRKHFG